MTSQTEQTARRSRHADGRRGRHQGADRTQEAFSRGFEALGRLAMQGVQVSGRATDLASGEVLFSVDDHVVMPTASIGKVLLLVEVAARLQSGQLSPLAVLDRAPQDAAAACRRRRSHGRAARSPRGGSRQIPACP